MFLDEVIIDVHGGKGGNGCVAWRREKYVPRGGPSGGDGGQGGSIVLQADANTDTLSAFATSKRFSAENGVPGTGKCMNGRAGIDRILHVPPGTIVWQYNHETKKTIGSPLTDLKSLGEQLIVARGGRGGFGNAHFTSSTRQAPDFAELGEPGSKCTLKLELKLVGDVGIIGYPSVGKSSLIAAVSSARPKIAAYPFTTLVPNLGVTKVGDREFVLCDVPGLIEGASEGKGLGDQFLRHIERCGILVHMLDVTRDDLPADYKAIRNELKAYSPSLSAKREVVVLNKIDVVGGDVQPWIAELKKEGIEVFASVSAATTQGARELMQKLWPLVAEERQKRIAERPEPSASLPVLRPDGEHTDRMGTYRVTEQNDGTILVSGRRLEQFVAMTDFSGDGGKQRFLDVVDRIGLASELFKINPDGKPVFIGSIDVTKFL